MSRGIFRGGVRPDAVGISGLLGAAGVAAVAAALGAAPKARWVEPVGAAAHLALMPFAAGLPGPAWARALGYAWLAYDAGVSLERVNGMDEERAMSARLGGHLLAAGWIAAAAGRARRPWTRWLGRGAAAALGGHTLVTRLKGPPLLLMASGPLLVGWLVATALSEPRADPRASVFRLGGERVD